MAAISDLIARIQDPELRQRVSSVVKTTNGIQTVETLDAASSAVRSDIKHLVSPDDPNNLFAKYN